MIVHKRLRRGSENRYLCNQACGVTKGKHTPFWKDVTCKNCLKQKPNATEKQLEEEMIEEMTYPTITEEEVRINDAKELGRLEGENLILKQILEQKLEITLIPKLYNGGDSF